MWWKAVDSDALPNMFFFQSGSWYKFNDEDIIKMEGKLKLSQDEDSAGV